MQRSPRSRVLALRSRVLLLPLLVALACAGPGEPVAVESRPVALALRLGNGAAGEGALIGLPGGRSFEYDPATLRLLRVREGDFARRRDDELIPTGEVVQEREAPGGEPLAAIAGSAPLAARLEDVWVRDLASPVDPSKRRPTPGLSYALVDPDGVVRARIEESVRAIEMEDGWGFVRSFLVKPGPYPCELALDLVQPIGGVGPGGVVTSGNARRHDWSLESGGRAVRAVHRSKPTIYQRLTKSQPRGVRYDARHAFVDLDRSPIRFEIAEQYVTEWADDTPRALDAALRL